MCHILGWITFFNYVKSSPFAFAFLLDVEFSSGGYWNLIAAIVSIHWYEPNPIVPGCLLVRVRQFTINYVCWEVCVHLVIVVLFMLSCYLPSILFFRNVMLYFATTPLISSTPPDFYWSVFFFFITDFQPLTDEIDHRCFAISTHCSEHESKRHTRTQTLNFNHLLSVCGLWHLSHFFLHSFPVSAWSHFGTGFFCLLSVKVETMSILSDWQMAALLVYVLTLLSFLERR